MPTLILFALLQGYISIPPIHILQPYHDVKCPRGYSVWWPAGKEFDDDRYAECIKPIARAHAKELSRNRNRAPVAAPVSTTNVSLKKSQRTGR